MSSVSFKAQNQTASTSLLDQDRVNDLQFFLASSEEQQAQFVQNAELYEVLSLLRQCSLATLEQLFISLEKQGLSNKAIQLSALLGVSYQPNANANYFGQSTISHVKQRAPWIVLLALFGIVSGLIIASYEDTLSQLLLLAIYMPVIAAAGGNAGTQAATLITRGLALGTIRPRQWLKVLAKESKISIWIATIVSLVMVARIVLVGEGSSAGGFDIELIAVAIAMALSIQIVLSTLLGGVMPLIAHKCKMDPAVMVSPILASLVDISGIWIYFTTVNWYLGIQ